MSSSVITYPTGERVQCYSLGQMGQVFSSTIPYRRRFTVVSPLRTIASHRHDVTGSSSANACIDVTEMVSGPRPLVFFGASCLQAELSSGRCNQRGFSKRSHLVFKGAVVNGTALQGSSLQYLLASSTCGVTLCRWLPCDVTVDRKIPFVQTQHSFIMIIKGLIANE